MIPAEDYRTIFNNIPGLHLILKPNPPHFTILDFNHGRAEGTRTSKATTIGKDLFESFPDNPNDPRATGVRNLTSSLMKVMETGRGHRMSIQKYDLPVPGADSFEEKYWSPENTPVLDDNGEVKYIVHSVTDVTAQVLLERKQQQAQAEVTRLSVILSKATNAVLLADSREEIQWMNKAFEDLFDVTPGDVLGKPFLQFLLSISDEQSQSSIREAVTLRQEKECEIHVLTRKKKRIFLRLAIQPLFEVSGKIHAIFAIATDITAIKKAEAIIFENEQRNRFILGNISDGITILDATGTVREVSPAGFKILEWEESEILNRKRPDLIHPEDIEETQKSFREVLDRTVNETTNTLRFRLPGGSYKWLECTFQNFIDEPSIHGIVLTFRDISERMQKDELLRASEKNYKYLFENNPAALLIWDPSTCQIVESNQTAQALTSYTKDELQQMSVFDIHPPKEHSAILDIVKNLGKKPLVTANKTTELLTRTGQTLYTNNSYHKITFYQRELVLGMIVDVTEKVALERQIELERTRVQHEVTDAVLTAQENERAHLGRELHDNINQILTTARLYLEHALTEEKNRLTLMQSSRDFIATAITEVRELSRKLVPSSLEGRGLVHAVDELIEKVRLLNKIEVRAFYTFTEDPLSGKFRLAVFRIIQEQVNNIIRHSKATRALVAIRKEGRDLTVILRDNGVGFDASGRHDGLGFKNITSRALVHNGVVSINAAPSKGCELRVRFIGALP